MNLKKVLILVSSIVIFLLICLTPLLINKNEKVNSNNIAEENTEYQENNNNADEESSIKNNIIQEKEEIDDVNESSKNYEYVPQIGMTKNQVLNSTWGTPKSIHEDKKGTGYRRDQDGKEYFYYERNGNKIWVNFENGIVVDFSVLESKAKMGKKVQNVEKY